MEEWNTGRKRRRKKGIEPGRDRRRLHEERLKGRRRGEAKNGGKMGGKKHER